MTKEILIADSDKGDQEEFQRLFESTDYNVFFSESSKETLMRMKLFKPDLIIASKNLVDENVFDLCKSIKSDPEYKNIPCLLLSNFFEEISEQERIEAGADGVISRPLKEDEILNMVDRLMEESSLNLGEETVNLKAEGWESLSDLERIASDELKLEEEEEEIIELVDVIEEGEARLSIDDIVPSTKEELIESASFQEPSMETEFERGLIQKEKEERPEDELFTKIELEEILQKVEQLRPSMAEELQGEKEPVTPSTVEKEFEGERVGVSSLEEFEAALKREVRVEPITESVGEEELAPISYIEQEEKEEIEPEALLTQIEEEKIEEEKVVDERIEEIPEEELPEEFFEEILKEEEVGGVKETKEEMVFEEAELKEEVIPEEIRLEKLEEIEAPKVFEGEKLLRPIDKQLEEVILKGIQGMVSDFITKILPEMTQNILNLTMERIEKMVSEIVPEMAEKAIREEIKRLKRGDQD